MTIFLYNFAPQIVNYITESIWPKNLPSTTV
ncbi:unknown [Prevotella sp. CAG:255]|nr:unknown [Prevotella sp. CAG:255]